MDREERRKSFVDSMSEEFDTARTVCDEYCAICPHNTCKIKMRREEEPVHLTQADIEAAMADVEEKSKAFTDAHQGESADEILAAMRGVDPAIQDIVDKHFCEMLGEEPASKDLEEELNNWRHNHFHGRRDNNAAGEYLERSSQLDLARHFADWQLEQMMKGAVEAEVKAWGVIGYVGTLLKTDIKIDGLDVYDRVKVIIVKTK